MYAFPKISITPSRIPPIRAPGIEPIPPNTAATNALIPGMAPVYGVSVGYAEQSNTPATAASAEPMANVRAIVPFTLMPISCAAPLSSETASMACPALDFRINKVRAVIITIQERMVTTASPVMVSSPPASTMAGMERTAGKEIVFAPNTKRAIFWSR